MRKTLWSAMLLGTLLLLASFVTAQETTPKPTMPPMPGMGSMMGMGAMGGGNQTGQTGHMGSMMQMMQGMMKMMENCQEMMGDSISSSGEKPKK